MELRAKVGAGLALAVAFWATGLSAQSLDASWFLPPLGSGSPYVGIEGGWSSLVSTKISVGPFTGRKQNFDGGDWDYVPHLVLGVRAGYELGAWSIEEELSHRHNQEFGFMGLGSGGNAPFGGERDSYGLMTNVIYNWQLPPLRPLGAPFPHFTPHAGIGIGPLHISDNLALNANPFAPVIAALGTCCLHGGTWVFGYQGIAGVRFEIMPNLLLDIDYRYIGSPGNLQFTSGAVKYKIHGGYQSHDSFMSLMWRFPPAVP